jgi:hypothetical protein
MTVPDPDPRAGLDPRAPGGLVEGGPADIPGVQDRGAADAAEQTEPTENAEQNDQTGPDDSTDAAAG